MFIIVHYFFPQIEYFSSNLNVHAKEFIPKNLKKKTIDACVGVSPSDFKRCEKKNKASQTIMYLKVNSNPKSILKRVGNIKIQENRRVSFGRVQCRYF